MKLEDYKPHSSLTLPETKIEKPRFSVIDAHNHLGGDFGGDWDQRPVEELIDVLDQASVELLVDLDGGWEEDILHHHLDHFKQAEPERFIHFGGVDWRQWDTQKNSFGEWAAVRLKTQAERGAQGLKVWKNLGLHVTDHNGVLVAVDDERLDPVWQTAGELRLPVLIHVADPAAFFKPLDQYNERWEELHDHPDWHFPYPSFPSFKAIIGALRNLVLRHRETVFIGAHVGCNAENLSWVSRLLDDAPNFYVDIGARIGELGRQPYTARDFFLTYADRILFGMDVAPNLDAYRLYYRFLESRDEYFNYSLSEIPDQGRWKIYGLYLPDDVLKKVYADNFRRIMDGEL